MPEVDVSTILAEMPSFRKIEEGRDWKAAGGGESGARKNARVLAQSAAENRIHL
jgi:hypothetical protein